MINKNFHILLDAITNMDVTSSTAYYDLMSTITDYENTSKTKISTAYTDDMTNLFKTAGSSLTLSSIAAVAYKANDILMVGTGTTTPTSTDYTLESPIESNLTHVSSACSKGYNSTTNKSSYVITRTFTYTGSSNITITEIGVFHNGRDASNYYAFLLSRELLDTPLTVSPGETFTVTMTLEF